MILLSGADLVLPDRVLSPGSLAIDGDRIVDVMSGDTPADRGAFHIDLRNHYIVPGFIDVHVHGVHGTDVMDDEDAVRTVAEFLPRHGVTAFCPTTIACAPDILRRTLAAVRASRTAELAGSRVLPAHLESNFISPEYKGAQPLECLRLPPPVPGFPGSRVPGGSVHGFAVHGFNGSQVQGFTAGDILDEIAAARPDVGIVTVAPELDGALDLIRDLVGHGHHVSLGHSGATYEEAVAGIEAGARQATHLFNRMPPLGHRGPGLAGAVLEDESVIAELVCDGVHVHPAVARMAIAAKRTSAVMAITDGTAGSGLAPGSFAVLGGRQIRVGDAAYLPDGTIAGSVLTMDQAFQRLVTLMGLSVVDAATLCSTTPARALNLQGFGVIAAGAVADLAILDRELNVVQTYIGGRRVFAAA
ncbi:MAG TPA: N-acetylglucosamine-6-phosphate deacetylase [Vicinamibacterales bacterium]